MLNSFFVDFNVIQNINPLGFILKIEGNVIGVAEFMSRVIFLINDFVMMNQGNCSKSLGIAIMQAA